ncbi:hypothetical protein GCM10011351_29380 [Paraliobacillus quinghaiensis]|uniref:Uncharacterized protein n=1 Tax=Paraliobacillus quinghaiensis TaxID=470815 RepID=A0A917TWF3_9BACI|nr:hypothetical protein [Paraliobacillus quinghaiensis]GGM41321.1 hypothetical protein GCM10011351_29380 [Paraliobacillus quinghaiensis]
MGGCAIFITKYYKSVLTVIVIAVLVFIGYSQYKEKKMYEEYISLSVKNDMQDLVNAIVDNERIYKNIIDEEVITKGDAYFLARNSGYMMELYQKYNGLAKIFERIEHGATQNTTGGTAQKIAAFFGEMIKEESIDSSNLDEVKIELNDDMRQKIITIKELNSLWVSTVKDNVFGVIDNEDDLVFNTQQFREHYGENSLSQQFWVNLVVDIEQNTQKFLWDNDLLDIDNVLLN